MLPAGVAVCVRPAREDDGAFLAWAVLASSRGHVGRGVWDVWIGDDEREVLVFLERLVLSGEPSLCWWWNFLVAEVDGRPAAALSGYDASAPGMADADPACRAEACGLGWDAQRLRDADRRLAPFERCLIPVTPGTWVVEWVATVPAYRRGGLVRALLDDVLDAGRRRGLAQAALTVFIGNDVAQRAYEHAGFAVVAERRDPGFAELIGCPGLRRMTRAL